MVTDQDRDAARWSEEQTIQKAALDIDSQQSGRRHRGKQGNLDERRREREICIRYGRKSGNPAGC
jgi:hypothetical protein